MSRHPLRPFNLLAGLAFLSLAVAGLAASSGLIDDGAAGVENGDVLDDTLAVTAIAWALALAATGIIVMIRQLRVETAGELATDGPTVDEQTPVVDDVNDTATPERL